MPQSIVIYDYWWVYIAIMIIFGIIIVCNEKENDILGKKLHKKLWQLPITIETNKSMFIRHVMTSIKLSREWRNTPIN